MCGDDDCGTSEFQRRLITCVQELCSCRVGEELCTLTSDYGGRWSCSSCLEGLGGRRSMDPMPTLGLKVFVIVQLCTCIFHDTDTTLPAAPKAAFLFAYHEKLVQVWGLLLKYDIVAMLPNLPKAQQQHG
ncbi:hypothetical protein U9M48_037547 [Paspalum notatum var. saurae]|uniref:Uncharacterized protein n=1 Tax=Paspalum notatum var. saurae TaxID=547442 RepID=A0AAQ3XB62_PASNO